MIFVIVFLIVNINILKDIFVSIIVITKIVYFIRNNIVLNGIIVLDIRQFINMV